MLLSVIQHIRRFQYIMRNCIFVKCSISLESYEKGWLVKFKVLYEVCDVNCAYLGGNWSCYIWWVSGGMFTVRIWAASGREIFDGWVVRYLLCVFGRQVALLYLVGELCYFNCASLGGKWPCYIWWVSSVMFTLRIWAARGRVISDGWVLGCLLCVFGRQVTVLYLTVRLWDVYCGHVISKTLSCCSPFLHIHWSCHEIVALKICNWQGKSHSALNVVIWLKYNLSDGNGVYHFDICQIFVKISFTACKTAIVIYVVSQQRVKER